MNPPRARAQIGGGESGHVEAEVLEGVFELETAAADVFLGGGQDKGVARPHRVAGLAGGVVVDGDQPRHDGALGLLAAAAEAAVHQFLIQSSHVLRASVGKMAEVKRLKAENATI